MKQYIYTGDGESETKIIDFEEENYILLEKDDQPMLCIRKHKIEVVGNGEKGATVKVSKAENFLRAVRERIIKEGLKNGTCKNV